MQQTIDVEIWSDIMCPFCYIGKRHFESAIKKFNGDNKINITWKSFQLNPDLKTEPGKNSVQHLAEIKGWTMDYARRATDQVTGMARNAGLTYHLDQAVVANSMDAHRLIQLAKQQGKGNEAEEELFKAHFTEGKNIADKKELTGIAERIGIDPLIANEVLESNTFHDDVISDQDEARQLGVRGVPFFVFNRKFAVSGAQPVDVFLGTLEKAAAAE